MYLHAMVRYHCETCTLALTPFFSDSANRKIICVVRACCLIRVLHGVVTN